MLTAAHRPVFLNVAATVVLRYFSEVIILWPPVGVIIEPCLQMLRG